MRRAPGEGSIFKRPDGSWQGYFPWRGRRVYRRGASRAEVRTKLREAHEELTREAMAAASAEATEHFLLRWLYEQAKPTLLPTSWAAYKSRPKRISEKIGKIPLAKLTHRDIAAAFADLANDWSDQTMQNGHNALTAALSYAVAEGALSRNPMEL